ncbi:MAG: creatininase family protein [Actinobacteria bacterium]|nr:MAG: creatininase family protein [Actinomycetota bacterium]
MHLLPLGATEPHGPHAPLSTDTLISVGICERAAERLTGEIPVLVLPALAYGVTRYGSAFPGTVSISEETLRALVTEIAAGVGPLVLVNSHFEPEQVETLRSTGLPLLDLTRRRNAERLTEEFRSGSCHAGPAAIRDGRTDFVAMGMDEAYCGAPAESSAEEGRATFDTLTDLLVELIREVAT